MVNNKTKKSAQMLAYVLNNDLNGTLATNEKAKTKCITIINNVVKVSLERATSSANLLMNLKEAMDYIASYIKDHCEGCVFAWSSENNIVKATYGLTNDHLKFSCDCEKTFKKSRGL